MANTLTIDRITVDLAGNGDVTVSNAGGVQITFAPTGVLTVGSAVVRLDAGLYELVASCLKAVSGTYASLGQVGSGAGTTCAGDDSRLSDARAPTVHASTHKHGGADEVAVAAAAANAIPKAGAGGTLAIGWVPTGSTSSTACIGNDSRLSDARVPTAHASTHQPGGSDAMAVDAAAGTGSLRTIGSGALQGCAGNDSRLSDARTPTAHASTHNAGGSDALAVDSAAGTGSLRTLGTSSTNACAGNDSRLSNARAPTAHASTHQHGGADEVGTATAAANSIPKSGSGSTLAIGWIPTGTTSLTVCIGNDSRLSDSRAPSGTAAGELAGTYPNPTISRLPATEAAFLLMGA